MLIKNGSKRALKKLTWIMLMISKLWYLNAKKRLSTMNLGKWICENPLSFTVSDIIQDHAIVNHNQEGFIKVWSINGALPKCLRDEDGGEDITSRDKTAETTLDFLDFDSGNKFSCDTSTCGWLNLHRTLFPCTSTFKRESKQRICRT